MALYHDDQTIVAQCTPQGSGALALIRISGQDAMIVADQIACLESKKQITAVPTHTIHYGSVTKSNNEKVDSVLFFIMHGPRSFTGENTVEITCHNNPFIIDSIIKQALAAGARMASNGEFSRRAVLNNKIDITQAEAINDLIHANTQHALKKSLAQLDGSFSHWIEKITQDLVKALALSEASFEFIDEEELAFDSTIKNIITSSLATIATIKQNFDSQNHIRQGIRIACIGSVNAGKSSLFNMLIKQERAIVTAQAGTTRDVIETGLYKNGAYWTMIDTAGLRQTKDMIEKEGIKRSHQEAHKADIVILVVDGSRAMTVQEQAIYDDLYQKYQNKIVLVATKSDLPPVDNSFMETKRYHSISTQDKNELALIEDTIQEKITVLLESLNAPFLLNQRQYNLLIELEKALLNTKNSLNGAVAFELLSHDLKQAISTLSELTGKSISEAGMDAVFRQFCVGK